MASTEPSLPPDLLQVLASLDTPEALEALFADLLTPAEIRSLRERWAIVLELARGKPQREVKDSVGVAIATVSRGAHQLRHGAGGFTVAFQTLKALGLPHPPIESTASELSSTLETTVETKS